MIPAFTLGAASGAAWRAGVSALALLAGGVAAAWLADWHAAELGAPAVIALALSLAAVVGVVLTLLRTRPSTLHWDGRGFAVGEPPVQGALDVCVDLGGWMLLRFRPTGARRPWVATWLPVSSAALGPALWHELRCALHTAAPVPARADV